MSKTLLRKHQGLTYSESEKKEYESLVKKLLIKLQAARGFEFPSHLYYEFRAHYSVSDATIRNLVNKNGWAEEIMSTSRNESNDGYFLLLTAYRKEGFSQNVWSDR